MNEKRNNCLFVFRAQHAMQQYTDLIKRYGNYSIDATKAHWKPAALAGGVIVGIWWLWMWRKYTAFKADIYNKLQTLSSTKAIGSDTIQYTTYGEGDYPILVLHGSPGGFDQGIWFAQTLAYANSSNTFVPVQEEIEQLKSKVTFILPSRPGYLNSSVSEKSSQVIEYSNILRTFVLRVIEERKLKDKVMVIGISGGGPHAASFARQNPDICDQLVMLSAISKPMEALRKMSPLTKKFQNWFFRHDSFSNVLAFLLQRYGSLVPMLLPIPEEKKYLKTVAGAQERLVELLKAGTCFTSRRIDGWHNDVALFDSLDNVPMNDITVPTLVLHGTEDKNAPVDNAYHSATVTNSQLKLFYGYGHLILPAMHYLRNFILERASV
jgi:pimeloyl-ACP methyl ester carboxylesterase